MGRGLLRYVQNNGIAARVTVYSRDESKHYALRSRYPGVNTVLGDICDTDRLAAAMAGHDVVIHAAALKYVPESERDVSQAVLINTVGSQSVAQAAARAGVQQVVGISTDKACSPRNTYGATKMLMERIFQEAQRMVPGVRYVNVRYGNVISSTGSVVPLFRDQLKNIGMVSITSPEMTRFWISIDDAIRLIEKALSDDMRRGHTYVARCAAMKILDVAQAVWNQPGQCPNRVIGTRPGEKLHEDLVDTFEAPYSMQDDSYIIIPPALSMAGEGTHEVMPYSSSLPDRWLTPSEFVTLIEDAERV